MNGHVGLDVAAFVGGGEDDRRRLRSEAEDYSGGGGQGEVEYWWSGLGGIAPTITFASRRRIMGHPDDEARQSEEGEGVAGSLRRRGRW